MAKRQTNLDINVTATDRASKTLDELSGEVRDLEGEHEIGVTADDKASDELADIRDKLDMLTDKDKVIALTGNASQLEGEIRRAERRLKDLDKMDGETIRVTLEARDNATKRLDAVRTELRQLDGEDADVTVNARGVDELEGSFENLSGAGGVAMLGRGGLIGGAAIGAFMLGQNMADAAISAQLVSDLTGTTVENASRLLTVTENNGIETEDLLDIILQMNDVLRENPELAEQLNVDLEDGKDLAERFVEVVDSLGDSTLSVEEKAQLMATTFGEEGVRQVGRMITQVGDLGDAVDDVPDIAVVSEEDVERAREFKSNWQETSAYIGAASYALGNEILPAINALVNPSGNPLDLAEAFRFLPTGTAGPIGDMVGGWFGGGGDDKDNRFVGDVADYVVDQARTVIINPPGTPAATVDQERRYGDRNGDRPV